VPPTDRARFDAATKHLDAPFAVADLAAFDANAADLIRRADGKPVRIASKSVRCRALLERALRMPGFAGVMSYSLAEALWLAGEWHGTDLDGTDILVAYPTTDHAALRALAGHEPARRTVSIMVDSPAHLDLVDAALGDGHPPIRVCLELDVSWRPLPGLHIGTRRSPVRRASEAVKLAEVIAARPGFTLVGMMAYEGQIAGLGDKPASKLRGRVLRWMQRRSGAELVRRRTLAVEAVREVADLEFVNGGGTGSIELTGADPSVTEVAAGSGLIGPTLFDAYTAFAPRPAVLFALPVVRRPTAKIVTLFSGGYIASGPVGETRQPSPYLPEGLKLLPFEGAGEVQTRHAKAGEPAERFTEYHLIEGDRVTATAPTYRGEGRSFG
jgi:D-serine deaminase-like pyridoxal phosphate-dependent protein